MKINVLKKAFHRNGVSGDPFVIYTFINLDEDPKTTEYGPFVAIDFGEQKFAVVNINLLHQDVVAFGKNSWRGDYYIEAVREAGKELDSHLSKYLTPKL